MAKVYVLGIGGSGSRIVRALMATLVGGASSAHNHEIIPVIIDVDEENKNTAEAFTFVDEYRIMKQQWPNNSRLFKTAVNAVNPNGQKITEKYNLGIAGNEMRDKTFSQFVGIKDSNNNELLTQPETVDFLKTLFEDNETELDLNMKVGFEGKPSLGAMVFLKLRENVDFVKMLNSCDPNTDSIFLIGSVFGGTGASGLPQIVSMLNPGNQDEIDRTLRIDARITSVPKACLLTLPYFSVKPSTSSSIIATSFPTKTRAAFSYYEGNSDMRALNDHFLLYDTQLGDSFENNKGGRVQDNDAHWIELIGASALFKFLNSTRSTIKTNVFFSDSGDNENNIQFNHLDSATQKDVIIPIIRAGIFWYLIKYGLKKELENKSSRLNGEIMQLKAGSIEKLFAGDVIACNNELIAFLEGNLVPFFDTHIVPILFEVQRTGRTINLFDFGGFDPSEAATINALPDLNEFVSYYKSSAATMLNREEIKGSTNDVIDEMVKNGELKWSNDGQKNIIERKQKLLLFLEKMVTKTMDTLSINSNN